MTPNTARAITDPAMCGSCHVVETEILDKTKTYTREASTSSRNRTSRPPTSNG